MLNSIDETSTQLDGLVFVGTHKKDIFYKQWSVLNWSYYSEIQFKINIVVLKHQCDCLYGGALRLH